MGEQWQRPALMFALVAVLGLCLGLALWRAFRDYPTDRVRLLANETRSNISGTENISRTESGQIRLVKRSECGEGVGWLDDPAYDIDPRTSNPDDDVWQVSGDTIILHVDRLVAMPHCIKTMSVAVGESIIEFPAPIEDEVTLNNTATGWDGCTSVQASVTVFDEQGQTDRREKNIEPENSCGENHSRGPQLGLLQTLKKEQMSPVQSWEGLCYALWSSFLFSELQERQLEETRGKQQLAQRRRTTRTFRCDQSMQSQATA